MLDSSAERDLLFDPWAEAASPHLEAISLRILEAILSGDPTRERKHSAAQIARLKAIVSALLANLVILHFGASSYRALALSLKHTRRTRYDRAGFGGLPEVMRLMAAQGLLLVSPAYRMQRRTCVEAHGWLLQALNAAEPDDSDWRFAPGSESIVLLARGGRDRHGKKLPKVFIDYEDTAETRALRAEMEEVNTFLANHRIELYGERLLDIRIRRHFLLRSESDPVRFDLHGRLYGGLWESLERSERAGLRINGEPIADLDFTSMFPRLAYAKVCAVPPLGDLYAVPELVEHRSAVKIGFSALLSGSTQMRKLPSEMVGKLPRGWTGRRFRQAVAATHPALVPLFGTDASLDLMFLESRILLNAMACLRALGVVALPMHDGMMVAESKAEAARQAMTAAALEVTGIALPVERKAV